MPGCPTIAKPAESHENASKTDFCRDFTSHWMTRHAHASSGVACIDTIEGVTGCKYVCRDSKNSMDHWVTAHKLGRASDEIFLRRRTFLAKQAERFGITYFPKPKGYSELRNRIMPACVNVPLAASEATQELAQWPVDQSKRRFLRLEGYFRRMYAKKDLGLTRQNWPEHPIPTRTLLLHQC